LAWIGIQNVRAQVPSQSPQTSSAIPLEYSGADKPVPTPQGWADRQLGGNAAVGQLRNPFNGAMATGQAPVAGPAATPQRGAPQGLASPQNYDNRRFGGRTALKHLRNPFDHWYGYRDPGLFGVASPQAGPTPQMPGAAALGAAAAPGGMPGAAAPGAMPGGAEAGVPGAPSAPSPTMPGAEAGGAAAGAADTFGAAAAGGGPGFGGTLAANATPFAMIGDVSPITISGFAARVNARGSNSPPGPPPPPGARGASPIFSSVRNFKISENQSPRPQDRVFFDFNYYNNLNNAINLNDLSPVTRMKAYVYLFGLEKTFNEGMGSIGIRLPLNNLTADSFGKPPIVSTPTSTSLGNLTIFGKYILCQNPRTGSLISALFAITPETGPGRFAGAPYVFPLNSTYFQPALGWIYNLNRWYFQGFSGFTFPANPNDVSLIYNDIGIGYFLVRNQDPHAFFTAIAPTFECHINNPINHRDWFNRFDLAGSPDVVDLTFGLNFGIRNTAVLTAAFVTPVTSPRPFDSEAILMLNIFYGRTRANIVQQIPPPAL
jgi:hypothetical protein